MKKFLLSTLCILGIAAGVNAETKQYQLCTDQEEILNPDNKFIMVSKPLSDKIYAVTNSTGTVEVAKVTDDGQIIAVDSENLGLFSIKDNGSYKIVFENSTGKYWYYKGSSTTIATGTTIPSSSEITNGQLSVEFDDNKVIITSQKATNRAFAFQVTAKVNAFKCYATSNITPTATDYCYPYFYKEVSEGGMINPPYVGYESQYNLEINDILSFPSISPLDLDYTFTTDDTDVVKIDNDSKTITAIAAGSATIKFSTPEVADKYNAGEGSFIVNVDGITTKMLFRDNVKYAKVGTGIVWQQVEVVTPSDIELRGDITYSSSDPDILSIDPVSGQITPDDVKGVGIVTITATMAAQGSYKRTSASYKIIIYDTNGDLQPSSEIFDFTQLNPYGLTTYPYTSGTMEKDVNEIVGGGIVATISFAKGDYRSWTTSTGSYQLRLQRNTEMTISVPEGYKISKIGLVSTGDKDSEVSGSFSPAGKSSSEIGTGEDQPNNSWTPANLSDVITSVTFKNDATAAQISYIYVEYESADSDLKSANLSFTTTINNLYMGEEGYVNAVNNPENLEVTYRIHNLDESKYQIIPEGKNLKVVIDEPGCWSLQAISNGGDGYRSGLAIMRVNVYRHLDVFVNDEQISKDEIKTKDGHTFITMNIPENTFLYYRIEETNSISTFAVTDDENQEEGFDLYEDGIDVPQNTVGNLHFYIANYGYKSPKRTLRLGSDVTTGVEGVAADAENGEAEYFNLNGVKVDADNLVPGLYIRRSGSKAEKVVVK
ncbi:MAG: hypothetical protein HDS55_05945 [Barnesiella sp.]|nr:hypothetical protein [Barnesiella sp.]